VDHPQQPGGERRIAADHLGNLRVQAGFGADQFPEGPVDALERGELGARIDPTHDLGFGKRGAGGGHGVSRLFIDPRRATLSNAATDFRHRADWTESMDLIATPLPRETLWYMVRNLPAA